MRVVPQRPGQAWLLGILCLGLCATCVFAGYRWASEPTVMAEVIMEQVGADPGLIGQIQELEQAVESFRLASVVESQAGEELRQIVGELEGRIVDLREEVKFYKRLMAPSELERGLQIAEWTVVPTAKPREMAYDLLLTQAAERRDWVQGRVNVDVLGKRSDQDVVLSLTELAEIDSYPLKFRFRYFQDFTGVIQLPADFQPSSIVVTAVRDNGQNVQRTFEWRRRNTG